jgi:hypothetical protein
MLYIASLVQIAVGGDTANTSVVTRLQYTHELRALSQTNGTETTNLRIYHYHSRLEWFPHALHEWRRCNHHSPLFRKSATAIVAAQLDCVRLGSSMTILLSLRTRHSRMITPTSPHSCHTALVTFPQTPFVCRILVQGHQHCNTDIFVCVGQEVELKKCSTHLPSLSAWRDRD